MFTDLHHMISILAIAIALFAISASGCAVHTPMVTIEGISNPLPPDTIWDASCSKLIDKGELMDQLRQARVVYVGERHTDPDHHGVQLQVIQALYQTDSTLEVGMEMFDHTYQAKLDRWSAGNYDWPTFLQQVHWYTNWRFNDGLYRDILEFVQTNHLKLVGLNIPFWLPPKIAIGGLDSLSAAERALLPEQIDTNDPDHRAYVQKIYNMHQLKGRDDFEHFYAAQCAWEDGMAQTIAENLGTGRMVVLVGNGHIEHKFGVPNRAFARTQAPFKTIYTAVAGETLKPDIADFIWVTH